MTVRRSSRVSSRRRIRPAEPSEHQRTVPSGPTSRWSSDTAPWNQPVACRFPSATHPAANAAARCCGVSAHGSARLAVPASSVQSSSPVPVRWYPTRRTTLAQSIASSTAASRCSPARASPSARFTTTWRPDRRVRSIRSGAPVPPWAGSPSWSGSSVSRSWGSVHVGRAAGSSTGATDASGLVLLRRKSGRRSSGRRIRSSVVTWRPPPRRAPGRWSPNPGLARLGG